MGDAEKCELPIISMGIFVVRVLCGRLTNNKMQWKHWIPMGTKKSQHCQESLHVLLFGCRVTDTIP